MALYINGNKTGGGGGGNSNMRELTQAEYDALTTEEKNNGTVYYITDGDDSNGGYQLIQPIIYSEEEREVGVWVDGKPLYQKTIDCGVAPAQGEIKSVAHNITSIDTVISLTGYAKRASDGFTLFLPNISRGDAKSQTSLSINSTNVNINNGSSSDVNANYNVYLTVQYTKTTDVAGSGKWTPQGTPAVHYSTEEQVVGTWVDGSVIYEKTVIVSNMMIGYDGTIHTSIPHNISNFGYAISLNILCPKIGISSNNILVDGRLIAEFRVDDTNIYANSGNDHYGQSEDRIWYFTIQYTKTTT